MAKLKVKAEGTEPSTPDVIGFKDIIGQDIAVTVLERAIETERIARAYLFSGLEGVGKTATALAFAAALNCVGENRQDLLSCGECWSCRALAGGNHGDIEVIAPDGSQTRIDQMREMRRMALFGPARGRWKVNIIERAESLNEDSASAILKILEEPPPYLVMILLTRNPGVILPTIRSRCQLLRFFPAPLDELVQALVERLGASEDEARIAAAYAEGRPGRAISLLSDESFKKSRADMIEIAERLSLGDTAAFLRLAEKFRSLAAPEGPEEDDSEDTSREEEIPGVSGPKRRDGARAAAGQAVETAILWYRDLLGVKLRGKDSPLINADCREQIVEQAARYPAPASLLGALDTLSRTRRALEGNANVRLVTDVAILRLAQAVRG